MSQEVVLDNGEKLQAIRDAEGLAQKDFAAEFGITLKALQNYEQGVRKLPLELAQLITTHPRFEKYALWLMTGNVAPTIGQISPDIEQRRTA